MGTKLNTKRSCINLCQFVFKSRLNMRDRTEVVYSQLTADCSQFRQCCMEPAQTDRQVFGGRLCSRFLVHSSTYNTV